MVADGAAEIVAERPVVQRRADRGVPGGCVFERVLQQFGDVEHLDTVVPENLGERVVLLLGAATPRAAGRTGDGRGCAGKSVSARRPGGGRERCAAGRPRCPRHGCSSRFPLPVPPAPPRTHEPSEGVSPLPCPITPAQLMITNRVHRSVASARQAAPQAVRAPASARGETPSGWRAAAPAAAPSRPPAASPRPPAADPPRPPLPGPAPPSRAAGRTAHTVVPRSSARTPQLEHRCSTMPRPRPPMEDSDGREARGRVALPPSLTMTSTEVGAEIQETRIRASGSGRACRIALLSSSLVTRAASPDSGGKQAGLAQLGGDPAAGDGDAGRYAGEQNDARRPHLPARPRPVAAIVAFLLRAGMPRQRPRETGDGGSG